MFPVVDIGAVETNPVVSVRDGGASVRVGGVSMWFHGDTGVSTPGWDGGTWRHNTMSWTHVLYAPDGITGFADWRD